MTIFGRGVLEVLNSLEEREVVNIKVHSPFIHLHSLSLSPLRIYLQRELSDRKL